KIRGFRIELGEIEAALAGHARVKQGVVVVHEEAGEKRLVAYVVPEEKQAEPSASELRQWLGERLPDHMVPAVFVLLQSIPLTPSGKVDRRTLPAPNRTQREQQYIAPRTSAERQLVDI